MLMKRRSASVADYGSGTRYAPVAPLARHDRIADGTRTSSLVRARDATRERKQRLRSGSGAAAAAGASTGAAARY